MPCLAIGRSLKTWWTSITRLAGTLFAALLEGGGKGLVAKEALKMGSGNVRRSGKAVGDKHRPRPGAGVASGDSGPGMN